MGMLCAWSVAWGQDVTTYKQEIRRLYKQGKQLTKNRQYKRALLKFKAALALLNQSIKTGPASKQRQALQKSRLGFLYIIGRTYHYDGRAALAYAHYLECLRGKPSDTIARLAKKHMVSLLSKVQASVTIRSKPSKARLLLRDSLGQTYKGVTPFQMLLPPDSYQLVLQLVQYQDVKTTIVVQPTQAVKRSFSLRLLPAKVMIESVPGQAKVILVDVKRRSFTGVTPFQRRLPSGSYQLRVILSKYRVYRALLNLAPGQTWKQQVVLQRLPVLKPKVVTKTIIVRKTDPPEPASQRTARILGWSSLGLALTGAGVGVALFVAGEDAIQQYNHQAGVLANISKSAAIYGDYELGSQLRTGAAISVAVGGVAAIAGVSLLVWQGTRTLPKKQKTSPMTSRDKSSLFLFRK